MTTRYARASARRIEVRRPAPFERERKREQRTPSDNLLRASELQQRDGPRHAARLRESPRITDLRDHDRKRCDDRRPARDTTDIRNQHHADCPERDAKENEGVEPAPFVRDREAHGEERRGRREDGGEARGQDALGAIERREGSGRDRQSDGGDAAHVGGGERTKFAADATHGEHEGAPEREARAGGEQRRPAVVDPDLDRAERRSEYDA